MHNTTRALNTMLTFRKNQSANPKKTSGWTDRRTDGQTPIYRTFAATARGPTSTSAVDDI